MNESSEDSTEVTKKEPSRQRKWQMARRARGLCAQCGAPSQSTYFCPECTKRQRLRARKRAGCSAWKPGGRGRPPKY